MHAFGRTLRRVGDLRLLGLPVGSGCERYGIADGFEPVATYPTLEQARAAFEAVCEATAASGVTDLTAFRRRRGESPAGAPPVRGDGAVKGRPARSHRRCHRAEGGRCSSHHHPTTPPPPAHSHTCLHQERPAPPPPPGGALRVWGGYPQRQEQSGAGVGGSGRMATRVSFTAVYEPVDDGWVQAHLAELPGVITAAPTQEEAEPSCADALREYLLALGQAEAGAAPAPAGSTTQAGALEVVIDTA